MDILELEAKVGDTFTNRDLLDRDDMAEQLSEVIDNRSRPSVFALDDGWGSGKSYFLKLWVAEHAKWMKTNHPSEKPTTIIYFDAFKHDYLNDPLAGLVIQLEEELIKKNSYKKIHKLIWYFLYLVSFLRPLRPLTSLFASEVSSIVFAVYDMLSAIPKEQEDSSWKEEKKRIRSMEEFKSALSRLAQQQKLVFIVDELDRCRPDYALQLLEIIKHFFGVKNVHFILGANFTALKSSVEATYGAGIDAAGYLKKFVNVWMRFLPIYDDILRDSIALHYFTEFCEHRIYMGKSPQNTYAILDKTKILLLKLPKIAQELSLRDINQLFERLSLFPKNKFSKEHEETQYFLLFAAILETIKRDYLNGLIEGTLDSETIRKFLCSSVTVDADEVTEDFLIPLLCFLARDLTIGDEYVDDINTLFRHHYNHDIKNESDKGLFGQMLRDKLKAYFTTFEIS